MINNKKVFRYEKNISSLFLSVCLLQPQSFHLFVDIDFSILYNANLYGTINSINVILNQSLYSSLTQNNTLQELFEKINDFIFSNNCESVYGFVFSLENNKNPGFYVEGIGNPYFQEDEQNKLQRWSNGMERCRNKIWDIFWGNLITEDHFTNIPTLLNEIKNIVGEGNIKQLENNQFWFNLSDSVNQFNINEYSKERRKLYDLFSKFSLVLTD